jgi:plasmid stabilization system protein ParE
MVPELGRPAVRELVRGSYRIVYRIDPDAARVLTIVHTARLLPKGLE